MNRVRSEDPLAELARLIGQHEPSSELIQEEMSARDIADYPIAHASLSQQEIHDAVARMQQMTGGTELAQLVLAMLEEKRSKLKEITLPPPQLPA